MFRVRSVAIVLAVISIVSTCSLGDIIFVDASSPYDPGSGTSTEPFRRIQDAINAAEDGDIIKILPGIYTGSGNYNLDPNGKAITIRSTDPNNQNVIENTIIDPNKAGRGFYIHSGEDANCIISGLTIRNGRTGGKGGGIFCYSSSPTITNCTISGNSAGLHGGGLFCQNSESAITRCVISNNSAVLDGGGLECWSSYLTIKNCIICDNQALNGSGGGVDCFNAGNPTLTNCTLAKNSAAGYGGALYCLGSNVVVKDNILWANEAAYAPQIALEPYSGLSSSVSVSYSDVQGGKTAVYDPSAGLVWGSGNIDIDPCFVSFDPNGDPNMWDFHLQSAYGRWDPNERRWTKDDVTSLCIDAGDPNSDWSDEPWPNGKRINMGAYGGTIHASMSGSPGDFNIDGLVNFEDFCELAGKWLLEGEFFEDLNSDGAVDVTDLGLFTQTWLWQR